jgi:hypothetical protein
MTGRSGPHPGRGRGAGGPGDDHPRRPGGGDRRAGLSGGSPVCRSVASGPLYPRASPTSCQPYTFSRASSM